MDTLITRSSTKLKTYRLPCRGVQRGKKSGKCTECPKFNSSNILLSLGRQDLPFLSCGIQAPVKRFPITHLPQAFWSQIHSPFLFYHSIPNSCPLLQGRYL